MHKVKVSCEGGLQLLVVCTAVQYQQVPVVRYAAQSTTTGLVGVNVVNLIQAFGSARSRTEPGDRGTWDKYVNPIHGPPTLRKFPSVNSGRVA
jgi:hypothetical protein